MAAILTYAIKRQNAANDDRFKSTKKKAFLYFELMNSDLNGPGILIQFL